MNVNFIERIKDMSNHEGFADPTAEKAVGRVTAENRKRHRRNGEGTGVGGKSRETSVSGNFSVYLGRHVRGVPLVYVCSRFSGANEMEVAEHVLMARRYSRFVLTRQAVPLTPHLLYPRFLRESVPEERELGIQCGLKLLRKCDELWAFVVSGISPGMRRELDEAKAYGIRIRFFDGSLQEVKQNERDL